MSAPILRVAVLGAGLIGREHCRLLGQNPRAQLVCVADEDDEAAAQAATLGGATLVHARYQDALDQDGIDAVIIALPNALHEEVGLACAARQLPTLIEKPIADTLPGALRIADAFRATNTPALIGHHRRHSPDIKRARDAVQQQEIGSLVAVNGAWLVSKPEDYFNMAWRRSAGGGPVLINLIHDLDCLRFIAGEIEAVQAISSNRVRGFEVEDTVALTIEFASGALGSFILSDAAPSPYSWETTSGQALYFPHQPENCYTFAGRQGTLTVPSMTLWQHEAPTQAAMAAPSTGHWQDPLVSSPLTPEAGSAYVDQLNHFLDMATGKVAPILDPDDASLTLAAALAVLEAAHTGHKVTPASLMDTARQ